MDLRLEFETILRDYGHPVLLIRQNKTVRCTDYNEMYQSSDKQCPICLGLGYLFSIEKHICRSQVAAIPETLPRMKTSITAGELAIDSKMFFLKYDVRPSKDDLIVECSWDGAKPIIDEYSALYEINYPQPYRGAGGEVIYFRTACKSDPVEATLRLSTIAGTQYMAIDRGD